MPAVMRVGTEASTDVRNEEQKQEQEGAAIRPDCAETTGFGGEEQRTGEHDRSSYMSRLAD